MAQTFDTPTLNPGSTPPPQNRNTIIWVIVIAVVAVVLLFCCCILLALALFLIPFNIQSHSSGLILPIFSMLI